VLTIKVTTVGASEGFILNEETKLRLNVQKGDTVFLTEAPDGAFRITPYEPDFARQMALAESVMHDDLEIMRILAK
jgi:hypothetical protein